MGAVKVDLTQKERALDAKYHALDSPAGVKQLLGDYHALNGRQYQGDTDAIVLLADLAVAIELAGLTDRQREALRLVYEEDMTQAKAGEAMGIAREVVSEHAERAIKGIAEIYYYWAGHGEGYETTIMREEIQ